MAEILGSKMEIPVNTLEEKRVIWENSDPNSSFFEETLPITNQDLLSWGTWDTTTMNYFKIDYKTTKTVSEADKSIIITVSSLLNSSGSVALDHFDRLANSRAWRFIYCNGTTGATAKPLSISSSYLNGTVSYTYCIPIKITLLTLKDNS